MNKKILFIILFLSAIIFSVLFFTEYFPKFQVVGPVTWYFRSDLTLSTTPTSSETYVSAIVPSIPIYFGIEFLADSRTLGNVDIQQFTAYVYPATTFTYSIKFNATINLNEDVKMKLYFRTDSSRFLEVTFSTGILKAGWFSVNGVLQYKICFMWSGSYDEVKIYYGSIDEYLNGISYFTPPPPSADFSYSPSSPCVVDNITFNASTSTGVSLTTYRWDFYFPNNTLYKTVIESGPITIMTLPVVGNWTVKLTVTDAYNQQGSTSKIVKVSEYPLSIDFSWSPLDPYDYDTVTFTATYYARYGVKSIVWNFGDDSIDFGEQVYHIYIRNGTYVVISTITDNNNMNVSISKQITVKYYIITVDFSYSPPNPAINDSITFTAIYLSRYTVTSVTWQFGDGSFDSGSPVYHSFSKGGVYLVNVTVVDINNKCASIVKQVTVKAKLEVISETPITQTYNLGGDYDFNAIFRIRDFSTKTYINDFDVKSINLTDSSQITIPIEWYKENFSIYVKAKVYKFYGKAEDKSLRLFFELSSTNHIGVSYSLTVKMVKPVIVIYMLDEKGEIVKGFVKGTNTFYLKFQGISNVDPRSINLTVLDPHGVKHYVSVENIVPSGVDSVKITYNFEEIGTYVFLVDYHGVVETSQTFTYQVVEPYNFFRWDNPLFVAFVIVIIAVMYSLVKRKKE
jgi:transcriptional/translational regulatory protein YebC/TACO1